MSYSLTSHKKNTLLKRSLFFFVFICNCHIANAQWYESQGSAKIINNDIKTAKNKATQHALKKALLVAGASVSSVQQVINGLLTQDEINIRASGTVNSFELIQEHYTQGNVTVTIRADIFPQDEKCFASDYKKSILLTRSHITQREHANIGNIYDLDQVVSKKLAHKIQQKSTYLVPKLALQGKTPFSRLNLNLQTNDIRNLVKSLGEMKNAQYVLFSEIDDLSIENIENDSWLFWQDDTITRQFNISLYLHDGITGERVLEKHYNDAAQWQFPARKKIDVNSQLFWRSEYGQHVEQILDNMISDINEYAMCQASQSNIVNVAGDTVTLDIGSRQGVSIGDKFSLIHLERFISDNNKSYTKFNISPYKVIVTNVTLDSAQARTEKQEILGNIQINDIATRY